MPDSSSSTKTSSRPFDQLLQEAPTRQEADARVSLVGLVYRTEDKDRFQLLTDRGLTFELAVADVRAHAVLASGPGRLAVEIQLDRSRFEDLLSGIQVQTVPSLDQLTFAEATKQLLDDITRKEITTDAINDSKSPAQDPSPFSTQGGGLAPFVLATPHHAPDAAVALQGGVGKAPNLDPLTVKELVKELVQDVTRKELVKDPISDATLFEAVGPYTLVEGVDPTGGVNPVR